MSSHHMKNKHHFLIGSAVGALLGTAAALLLAPQSGKKTRKELQKMSEEISGLVSTELPKLKKISKEAYEGLVDSTVKEYGKKKKLAETMWKDLSKTLKAQWKEVEKKVKT